MKRYFLLFFCLCLFLSGCNGKISIPLNGSDPTEASKDAAVQTSPVIAGSEDLFSDRDKDPAYNAADTITLTGSSAQSTSKGVSVSGGTVTITREGTYLLTGTLNGMVIVNTDKTDKVQLVLDNASIHSETSAAIYVLQADKVFITLADGSDNTLSSGESYTAIDENNIDAAVFSKEDLTLNGTGTLTVNAPGGHGIVSKDELVCTGGTYVINTASHGLSGKDCICIVNADLQITSGKDGIHSENADDTSLGFVHLESGSFTIRSEGDGISASSYLQILDGKYDIVTGGGSENGEKQTSDSWGGFMGGGMGGRPGGAGGHPGGTGNTNSSSEDETDSTSIKGLKATSDLLINGGSFTIDSADDAVHSNANIQVNGGSFLISTGDDGFHADDILTVANGTVTINASYEGLEALHVSVTGGEIMLTASDDGINAAGGTDQSGFGGHRGNDKFGGMGGGMGGSSNGTVEISGGKLYIKASGDGIDANGTLSISGGHTTVCGPTQGDTATLDYDTSAVISGGTFIGTGASGMAQTFSDSKQGVIAVSVGNQSAKTEIVLTDSKGNTVISYTPELSFAVVILSSPDIIKGETYTITVGSASGSFEAY